MYDLASLISNDTGWTQMNVDSINNNGQIAGEGTSPSGQPNEAFILNPITVPEPASLAVAGVGSIGLMFRRRTRTVASREGTSF